MQVKTINKILKNKIEDWLQSINDVKLRNKVRQNYLISGGSITSLFLDIPVNDYDIYIQDMDVLIELSKYYCPNIVLDGRLKKLYLENLYKKKYGNNWECHYKEYLKNDLSQGGQNGRQMVGLFPCEPLVSVGGE